MCSEQTNNALTETICKNSDSCLKRKLATPPIFQYSDGMLYDPWSKARDLFSISNFNAY